MAYSPAKHTSQKYGKDNEGHYHYKDKSGKPIHRFSTTPVKMESAKQEKYNLMHDNPVAKDASWMSKHSQSAINYGSPLNENDPPNKKDDVEAMKRKLKALTELRRQKGHYGPDTPSGYDDLGGYIKTTDSKEIADMKRKLKALNELRRQKGHFKK